MDTKNIKMLASLAGYIGRSLSQTAKLFFATGIPDDIFLVLQQIPGVKKIQVNELISTERVLTNKRSYEPKK